MEPIGDTLKKIVKKRNFGASLQEIQNEVLHDKDVREFLAAHKDKLNKKIVETSFANLYEYYSQKQKSDHVMNGYQPELFISGDVIDIRYAPTKAKIEADKEINTQKHLELIDLPKNLRSVKLSNLDISDERSDVMILIRQFLNSYKENNHQKGLYLSGNFGVGKTYMLAGLANSIAATNKNVIFLHVPTFIASLSSHFEDNSLNKEIKRVSECDVLILDDIGAETLSQWSRDDVLGVILQARMDNVLPTFFSSNLDMDKLEKHFAETKNAVDSVKAARLMQRVRFLAKEVIVSGENRRI